MTIDRMIRTFGCAAGARTLALACAAATATMATADEMPTRSTSLALTEDGGRLVTVNAEADSVTVFRVTGQNGAGALTRLAEIPVGQEPCCVAVLGDSEAYVTNGASGTVSVIRLQTDGTGPAYTVAAEIRVGTEPRGCALTPRGERLYVANHTSGTVSVIDTATRTVAATIFVGGNPMAIAITADGIDDAQETVFVTRFYAEVIPGGPGEGFDDGKQGVVVAFNSGFPEPNTRIALSPLADVGFTADRTAFCASSNPNVHSEIFCPDVDAPPGSDVITADPQGAFPNQLHAALIRGSRLYLPSIGAGPEPPVAFNTNVQALVHVVNTQSLSERRDLHVNLNAQIKTEPQPAEPTESTGRLFGNDVVAIDATADGADFLIVSRGGNYVIRAKLDEDGRLDIGAPDGVVRFQTGNIPNGVVIDADGRRAYVNNEVGLSVSVLDLESDTVLARDIPASAPPEPGTLDHAVLVGKLVFFTALGTPDDGLAARPVRSIEPLRFRGKASDNGWSGCASCHPSGLADGVTWIFATGPRQTVPLDGFFSKSSPADQRVSNWNAVRGSITDFNNNSRNVQGGLGFAGDPPDPNIFNHGVSQGASDALDFETLWVQSVRPFAMPSGGSATDAMPGDVNAGRALFETHCASCHGGPKWTKSQIFHADNAAFDGDPLAGGQPLDRGILNAGPQIRSYERGGATLQNLEGVGTFDAANPLEIRGAGAIGTTALGGLGFNVPSLLGVGYHAPYLHHGAAPTLESVFALHALDRSTIEATFSAAELENLARFLRTIDGRTAPMRSEADDFREQF